MISISGLKSHDDFIRELYDINKHIIVNSTYTGALDKVHCICDVCGNEWDAIANNLLRGSGCRKCYFTSRIKKADVFIQEVNNINPYIEIIGNYKNNNSKVLCRCLLCNTTWNPVANSLLKGHGCPNCSKNMKKDTSTFIKQLQQISPNIIVTGKYVNATTPIECKCKQCGNNWFPLPNNLLLKKYGCPECAESLGEKEIKKYLEHNLIIFERNKKYKELVGIGKRNLSYDFYLNDYNLLIEFQGKQHEQPIDYFGGEKSFVIQKEHDKLKRDYAFNHNIRLLEIWYFNFKHIDEILNSELSLSKGAI